LLQIKTLINDLLFCHSVFLAGKRYNGYKENDTAAQAALHSGYREENKAKS
jgi:hypothetical protein